MAEIARRLQELGIVLPPPPTPRGSYTPVVRHGSYAWVAGQIALEEGGGVLRPGLVDRDVPVAEAQTAARRATLQALSALDHVLGGLDSIAQVVRVTVYVASAPGFTRSHEVANGASDLLVEIFGEGGRPARVAVGVAALPLNAPVEVEIQVAISG